MRVDFVTKEYPPHIYGGAGVHVTELVRSLRSLIDVRVHAFGAERPEENTTGYPLPHEFDEANPALQTLATDLSIVSHIAGADLVHSHTWYANFAGFLANQLHDIPHVVTAHSLEPLRPWKAEQLGGGYRVSSWIERTAFEAATRIIAVSAGMRDDILRSYPAIEPELVHVIHNGIDTIKWQPRLDARLLQKFGIDSAKPTVTFVGRITRQKGLQYFLRAAEALPRDVQIVLCAGAPDGPEIAAEVKRLVSNLQTTRSSVVWIEEHLPQPELATILSHSSLFVCPSIYEPLGIVNLEAMACGVPVVGTATGGIPEVVIDGETGWLVPVAQLQDGTGTPIDEERFVRDWAETLVSALESDDLQRRGELGRKRAEQHFAWDSIAKQTRDVYQLALG